MTVVINPHIHVHSGLDRRQFLGRLSGVQEIRTNSNLHDEGLTVYIHSVESFNYYRHLKDAVCIGDFCGLDGRYRVHHFGVDVAEPLLHWFERCEFTLIQKQVICWLTALYARNPSSRHIMEEQIYPPVMGEIRELFAAFYEGKADYEDDDLDIRPIYTEACYYYYNSVPPEILTRPGTLKIDQQVVEDWRVQDTFDIRIGRFWFRESDWKRVVLEQVDDNMRRENSSRDYFSQWKHQFSSYDSHQKHIYGLFDGEISGGFIYVIEE